MADPSQIPTRFQVNNVNGLRAPNRQLFQTRPAGTSAVTAWTAPYFGQFKFNSIRAANTTASPVDVSIFHDIDGSTYDQDTALEYVVTLPAYGSLTITDEVAGYLNGETIGIQTSTGSAVNFTGYGTIDKEEVKP